MIPPECLDLNFGQVGYVSDLYHVALLMLAMLNNKLSFNFSHQDIWEGEPEKMALELNHELGDVLANALKRFVHERYQTSFGFWQAITSSKSRMLVSAHRNRDSYRSRF